jgi:N-acetylmuramoyl-L-alanine amidase
MVKCGIDPGHGQIPPTGAVGPSGLREDDINLEVAYQMSEFLKKNGYETLFFDGDLRANSNQGSRAAMAFQEGCVCHIAVHMNASEGNAGGFEAWANDLTDQLGKSIPLAQAMCALCAPLTLANRGVKGCSWQSNTQAITNFPGPAVIAECAFISNPIEEAKMMDYNWRMQMGQSLAKAVMQTFPLIAAKHYIDFEVGALWATVDNINQYPLRAPVQIVPPGVTEVPVRELIDILKLVIPEMAGVTLETTSSPQGISKVRVVIP